MTNRHGMKYSSKLQIDGWRQRDSSSILLLSGSVGTCSPGAYHAAHTQVRLSLAAVCDTGRIKRLGIISIWNNALENSVLGNSTPTADHSYALMGGKPLERT